MATGVQYPFQVEQSWGVCSLRQCAGFPDGEMNENQDLFYVTPLGPLIVCWDISTHEKKVCFQAHSDLIISLLYNKQYSLILSISYGGEIKLWNQNWELKASTSTTYGCAHYGAWSLDGNRFLICGGEESLVAVYELEKHEEEFGVKLLWLQKGPSNEDTVSRDDVNHGDPPSENNSSPTYVKQRDWYDIAMFNSKNQVIALLQKVHDKLSEAHLYDQAGKLLCTQQLDPIGNTKAAIMCSTPCKNGVFAVGFQGGIFLIINESIPLNVNAVFQATGSPQVAIWDGDYILAMSYLSGIITWWSSNGELYYEIRGAPRDSVVHLSWSTDKNERGLWVGGIMSLSYIALEYSNNEKQFPCKLHEKYRLKYHAVTGCGLDISKEGMIASGDLTGNVFVWKQGNEEPLHKLKYEAAVRSLAWRNETLFVGCLDGIILKWCLTSQEEISLACTGGILTMRWLHDFLAIGLDNGSLLVYKFHADLTGHEEVLNFKAHSMMRDGRAAPAEVWSVCWSPCGTMIATASEDHTACVWNATSGEKLQTLYGHTTAVTSVDWKLLSSQQSILATCADDRTVRVIDSSSYDVIHVLKIAKIPGWYTLTYLSLDPIGQRCLCSTQNGRLALWDCLSGELLVCRKVHCGSIEGLVYTSDYRMCATVSSDCVVNLFSIHV